MGNPGKSAKTGRRSATEKAQDVEDARKADVMVNSKALDHLKQTNTRKAPPPRKALPPTGGRPAASTSRTSRSSILDKHKAKFTGNGRSGSVHGEESRREAERAEGTAASDDDADESDGLDRDETNEGLEEELEVAEGLIGVHTSKATTAAPPPRTFASSIIPSPGAVIDVMIRLQSEAVMPANPAAPIGLPVSVTIRAPVECVEDGAPVFSSKEILGRLEARCPPGVGIRVEDYEGKPSLFNAFDTPNKGSRLRNYVADLCTDWADIGDHDPPLTGKMRRVGFADLELSLNGTRKIVPVTTSKSHVKFSDTADTLEIPNRHHRFAPISRVNTTTSSSSSSFASTSTKVKTGSGSGSSSGARHDGRRSTKSAATSSTSTASKKRKPAVESNSASDATGDDDITAFSSSSSLSSSSSPPDMNFEDDVHSAAYFLDVPIKKPASPCDPLDRMYLDKEILGLAASFGIVPAARVSSGSEFFNRFCAIRQVGESADWVVRLTGDDAVKVDVAFGPEVLDRTLGWKRQAYGD